MTAPLPPLPVMPNFGQLDPGDTIGRAMQRYAKLAVREALERVDALCNEVFRPTPKDVSDKIRAMLKEYK